MNKKNNNFFKIFFNYFNIRTGKLKVIKNHEVTTPNFLICSSFGSVPHITPDHLKSSRITGIYMSLEDLCVFSMLNMYF